MFRGNHSINLDGKGRFSMPTKYREEIRENCDGRLVVTADRDKCLLLYPLPEWEEVERKLTKLPTFNKQATAFKRFTIGYACECDMDAHGKVLLPDTLRKFANMEKRIVLSGQMNKFEIWDEDAWEATRDIWLDEKGFDELKEVAGDLAI